MHITQSAARLRALRDARRRSTAEGSDVLGELEEGFTLIELMVVLLIMAILLAIAIPTFLSVTGGAKRTAAQSNLTNATESAQALATKNSGSFGGTVTAVISTLQKTLTTVTFTKTKPTSKTIGKNIVMVTYKATNLLILSAEDASGGCWAVAVNSSNVPVDTFAAGDTYFGGTVATAKTKGKVTTPTWCKPTGATAAWNHAKFTKSFSNFSSIT
jgi:type IV pilus assembly protein PilA